MGLSITEAVLCSIIAVLGVFIWRTLRQKAILTMDREKLREETVNLRRQVEEERSKCKEAARRIAAFSNQVEVAKMQNSELQGQLEQAVIRIIENDSPEAVGGGLLEKAVEGLVALGVPGLILLMVMAGSGFAGAVAVVSALATLGGPLGMIGGVGVLMLLALVSRALADYGLAKVSELVVKGLVAKGHSRKSIYDQVAKYPNWVISRGLRSRIYEVVSQHA